MLIPPPFKFKSPRDVLIFTAIFMVMTWASVGLAALLWTVL